MITAATAAIGAFWGWYFYDEYLTARLAKKAKPVPLPRKPTYKTGDVSIVVATINTPDTFTDSLRLWLANLPKEIIIVTIERDLQRVVDLVQPVIAEGDNRITVLTADYASKRAQMVVGIEQAKGKILACVDDDAFWSYASLEHLIAPFEDPKVGGAVGKQSAHIPRKRRDPTVITPWEVASIKSLDNQNNNQAVRFAADGSVFCLVGRTMMVRADIAKDPKFTHAIKNEFLNGKRLNSGDDVFLTRWLLRKGWKMSIQNAPEAEITTEVMRDSTLVLQMFRWQRSAFQSFWKTLFVEPGISKIWK
ncbi:hypothetical protein CkaCkLH20_05216 [Colletotrichum karsti]|uniref:Glycosyltransferase family 2 n=1 Tax=Colletotrichum karsti TaxID=1095194 RepID=A0A9P6LLU2_9PEZI|nr:uncharacterized protein CkaCkLH20_05216 [Colletotrichum karsti]KAF9877516.1 hypothetical protein CkaCkLH20_05216 [Colletotrichum karsti]